MISIAHFIALYFLVFEGGYKSISMFQRNSKPIFFDWLVFGHRADRNIDFDPIDSEGNFFLGYPK